MNPSRRRLLRHGRPEGAEPRLPWLDTARFLDRCTACGACADACPEGIVVPGDGGLPRIDFSRGGCTFCARCADACPEALFTPRDGAPWPHRLAIDERCLTHQGVICQSCRDACEPGAIRFPPIRGGAARPVLDAQRCTACGACTSVCPAGAIRWTRPHSTGPHRPAVEAARDG